MTNPNEAQMKLRLPAEMRDRIAELAKANNRSMNAEIVARLERSLSAPDGPPTISQDQIKAIRDDVLSDIRAELAEHLPFKLTKRITRTTKKP